MTMMKLMTSTKTMTTQTIMMLPANVHMVKFAKSRSHLVYLLESVTIARKIIIIRFAKKHGKKMDQVIENYP